MGFDLATSVTGYPYKGLIERGSPLALGAWFRHHLCAFILQWLEPVYGSFGHRLMKDGKDA